MNKIISLRIFALASLMLLISVEVSATHLRAAELVYEFTSANTIRASAITYYKANVITRDSMPIHWGDGSPDDMVALTDTQLVGNGFQKNVYTSTHTYTSIPSAPNNFYIISMTDPNRNSDIVNINNSVNVQLYVEDTIWFQGQGLDHSPVFLTPLTGFALVADTFFFFPNAFDAEGDSMTFEQVEPLQGLGNPVPGYFSPYTSPYIPGDTETLDRHTGLYMWAVPQMSAQYDIAILTKEYRNGVLIGTALRDMIITVTTQPAAISETANSHPFVKIYPNPAKDKLTIDYPLESIDIIVSDMTGRIYVVPHSEREMDISSLSAGVYCILLQDKSGTIIRRFVKE